MASNLAGLIEQTAILRRLISIVRALESIEQRYSERRGGRIYLKASRIWTRVGFEGGRRLAPARL